VPARQLRGVLKRRPSAPCCRLQCTQ
jgi:hypothetical protein